MFRTRNIAPEEQFVGIEPVQMSNAMPSRPRRHAPRNLTGLYLGVEGERSSHQTWTLPPGVARGRGMPSHRIRTPTELRRYLSMYHNANPYVLTNARQYTNIPHLPPMPLSRYPLISPQRKVELLRTKEFQRGFSGNPLKRRPGLQATATDESYMKPCQMPEPMTFSDLTRQTKRNFTAANNAGVTHLEYLGGEPASRDLSAEQVLVHTVTRDIHAAAAMSSDTQADVSGLVECYKKVCRNNQETLNTLLPMRKLAQENRIPSNYSPTGFCVKSYRNPKKAEILATFPDPEPMRPKTVLGVTHRAFVPSPYFFKGYTAPSSAIDRYSRVYSPMSQEDEAQRIRVISKGVIVGAPGTGSLSRTVSRGNPTTTPRASNTPVDSQLLDAASKPSSAASLKRRGQHINNQEEDKEIEHDHVTISVPAATESIAESTTERTQHSTAPEDEDELTEDDLKDNAAAMMDIVTHSGSKLEKTPSGSEIIIGLENESGEPTPVDIDDTDDQLEDEVASNGSIRRKVSITGRILKSKNSEEQVAQLHQDAMNRKKQLENLLDEHAQIVHEVEVAMEGESGGEEEEEGDKENSINAAAPAQL